MLFVSRSAIKSLLLLRTNDRIEAKGAGESRAFWHVAFARLNTAACRLRTHQRRHAIRSCCRALVAGLRSRPLVGLR